MDNENEKQILKHLPFPFFPGSALLLIFLYLLSLSSVGEIIMGLWVQAITHCLCCSFLLRGRTPCSLFLIHYGIPPMSHISSLTAPVWLLAQGAVLWEQTASVLVCPTGSKILPANLLQCVVLSPSLLYFILMAL